MLASIFPKTLQQKWIFTVMDTCQKITEEETFYILVTTYYTFCVTATRNKNVNVCSPIPHKLRPHEQQRYCHGKTV